MLCANIWLLSFSSELFGWLAVLFAIAACVLAIVALRRDLARGSGYISSALAALTVFVQLGGFLDAPRVGPALVVQLASTAVLAEAYPL